MSEENVEVVRSILAKARRARASMEEFLGAWDHFATEPERFIDVGDDRVLVLVRFQARGRASGTPTTAFSGGQLFTLRDGKVVRLVLFSNRTEALEAAGLSE